MELRLKWRISVIAAPVTYLFICGNDTLRALLLDLWGIARSYMA